MLLVLGFVRRLEQVSLMLQLQAKKFKLNTNPMWETKERQKYVKSYATEVN